MGFGRLVLAIAASAALVLSAPFLGEFRRQLQRTFPAQFVVIVGASVAAAVVVAILIAIARMRTHRGLRLGAIAAAVGIAAVYSIANAGENRDSNVVELVHFLQYGVVTLLFYRAFKSTEDASMFLLPVLAGVVVGTAEEGLQWFLPARVGEIRDLYLNLTAIGCGLLFSVAADPPGDFRTSLEPGSRTTIGRWAAAAILALAAFIHVVHLGFDIRDDEIGVFESRYSPGDLHRLGAARAAEWRIAPPTIRPPRLSREDQYMTEGLQHVQQRNKLWDQGDALGAWSENRILEKYFAAVLDTPSYVSGTGHRWPAPQLADATARAEQSRAANPAIVYISDAYPYPIATWPRVAFWAVVAALVIVVLITSSATDRPAPTRRSVRL